MGFRYRPTQGHTTYITATEVPQVSLVYLAGAAATAPPSCGGSYGRLVPGSAGPTGSSRILQDPTNCDATAGRMERLRIAFCSDVSRRVQDPGSKISDKNGGISSDCPGWTRLLVSLTILATMAWIVCVSG
jgi:hypothetical protein